MPAAYVNEIDQSPLAQRMFWPYLIRTVRDTGPPNVATLTAAELQAAQASFQASFDAQLQMLGLDQARGSGQAGGNGPANQDACVVM